MAARQDCGVAIADPSALSQWPLRRTVGQPFHLVRDYPVADLSAEVQFRNQLLETSRNIRFYHLAAFFVSASRHLP